jgi:hypothetical protein
MTHPLRPRLALRPDLTECTLEDRVLMAYSPSVPPVIWTTSGFIVLSVPPGLSSALNNSPGSGGSSGGNMPTSFNISGFGPSSLTIGNSTGYPSLNPSGGAGSSNVGGGGGGGGGGSNSSPTPNPSNNGAFGGAFSSGYNTSLDSSNNYGMSTSPVGSIPVHTYADRTEEVAPLPEDSSGALAGANRGRGIMGAPTSGPGGQGSIINLWNNLLGKKPTRTTPQPSGSSLINP